MNPDKLKIEFGKNVRTLRLNREMTQAELAEQCDVSIETISHVERGIHGPKFELLAKIASSLNIPVHTLFEFTSE